MALAFDQPLAYDPLQYPQLNEFGMKWGYAMRHPWFAHLSSKSRALRLIGLAAIIALATTVGSVVTAFGSSPPTMYYGCVEQVANNPISRINSFLGQSGTLYGVTTQGPAHCKGGDTAISWSQAGPSGPSGPSGPTGSTGPSPASCTPGEGANLVDCDFQGADLFGQSLFAANLAGANLSGANLKDSTLVDANLYAATLTNANMEFVTLDHANFTNADLTGADVKDPRIPGTIWNNTICPDGTNSDSDGGTCDGNLTLP